MDLLQTMNQFLDNPNAFWVLAGTTILGLCSGVLGSFAFLRKRGLMGDVLAHAALPGICLAFLLTGSKNPILFLIGATITGLVASLCIQWITKYSRIKEDTALSIVLSVFFGAGIVLLTFIQHSENGNQSGLDKFLFGQSAAMVRDDLLVMGIVATALIVVCTILFKELKLLCFDIAYGKSIGFPMGKIDFMFMFLLVVAVVIGLQAAGVVLMAALLITPAAAARYWTERLDRMVIISAVLGALSGGLGTFISAIGYRLSTGPLIVLSATTFFLISMLFAPKRGLLARWIRRMRTRRQVVEDQWFENIFTLSERTGCNQWTDKELYAQYPALSKQRKLLSRLVKQGYIIMELQANGEYQISLTQTGWNKAYETILYKRMLEVWMMHENEIDGVVQQYANGMNREIPKEVVPQLQSLLKKHNRMPTLPRLGEEVL
ncbi:metal ABC transporter permease [Hazenella sp. IB182353]|uniref:metal ABC transporter permease n=1 Tax=Polycladospora coralii TaxID=2771432 RepID=UPI0017473C09|nr:metal ABC transporter permease [Polycladospora coralii]MBS7531659.1 metal ABC transporter permease [Polycladospora coralii]